LKNSSNEHSKFHQLNDNSMKYILSIIVLYTNLIGCNRKKIDESLLEGKWRIEFDNRIEIITFKEGLYFTTTVNDDLIYETRGKYFLNENKNRSDITISLLPDLKYINGDNVMESCQYLDLINLTDSTFIIKTPTEYSRDTSGLRINKKIIARKKR
jgi:hypothetical protein